jgi:hypothetical protein
MPFRALTTSLSCLTLVGFLSVSAPTAGSEAALRPSASPAPKRPRRLPQVEGCFEPPPEPVAPPPCTHEESRP